MRVTTKINKNQVPVDVRLEKFKKTAAPLMADVARRAIHDAGISDVSEISKLVVVSSTGFSGPGLDCALINDLGLPRSMDRTLIGLMGCAAAINGFRVASDYVRVRTCILWWCCCSCLLLFFRFFACVVVAAAFSCTCFVCGCVWGGVIQSLSPMKFRRQGRCAPLPSCCR